jgi:hypothetical protein
MTRPGLRTFDLTSHRASFRRTLSFAMIGAAIVAAIGYVLPAHRLEGDTAFHSNFDDGGVLSILILAAVAAIVFALRKLRFGSGMISGVVSAGGALAAIVPVVLAHLFSSSEDGYGETVFAVGVLALFFTGLVSLFAEPLLYVLERRSKERALRPAPLPIATIASRV